MHGALRNDDGLSSKADKALFFIAFVGGTALVLGLKLMARPGLSIAAGVMTIVVYCAVAWSSPRLRLREDRIGDGAYYLGFLLTLVSLAYALWQFSGQPEGTQSVISGFGLALATTIVGLALRVMFQQLREDPEEFEREARVLLSDAVADLEREVRKSVENLVVLRDRVMQELNEAVGTGLQRIVADNRDALRDSTAEFQSGMESALEGVRQSVDAAGAQAADTKKVIARVLGAIDRLADRIDQSGSPTDTLVPKVAAIGAALEAMVVAERGRTEEQRKAANAIATLYEQMGVSARASAEIVATARQSAVELQEVVKALTGGSSAASAAISAVVRDLASSTTAHQNAMEQTLALARENEADLAKLRTRIASHVNDSAAGLTALQSQVVGAAETIIRELRPGGSV